MLGLTLLYAGLFFACVTLTLIMRRRWHTKRPPLILPSEDRSGPVKILYKREAAIH